jgi:HSP20 family protein
MAKKEREKELTPTRPPSEMFRWEREMDRVFDDFFFGRRLRPLWPGRWWPTREIALSIPPVDLYEEKDEIVVKTDLPGMSKEDIQVNVTDHLLIIKGEKKKEEEIKEGDYYRSERSYGSFSRSVDLPGEVQIENAKASFKNGVLEIRLPKTEEAKRREIKVKVE